MLETDQTLSPAAAFAARCVAIDCEIGVRDGRLHDFAAVRGDGGRAIRFAAALAQLDAFARGADFLLGHNIVAFDAPRLAALRPDLQVLKLPLLDTLRLNPLAFPRRPYHRLVKVYQDGAIHSARRNDPEADARLALRLLIDQHHALREQMSAAPALVLAYHGLVAARADDAAADAFLTSVRGAPAPQPDALQRAIAALLVGNGCAVQAVELLADPARHGWPLAYALAWLSVAEGSSVLPCWVRHQFPEAGRLVRLLRDTPCDDPACAWCRERHDAHRELKRWFPKIDGFRVAPDGRPLQQRIVEGAMRGRHVLGILPTGTGKSICYQLPALSRYAKTGALTIVISPLVALMADQVAGLEQRGIACAAALNGLLSMPERGEVLERVRLGDVGILIVSPEQLRGRSLRRALDAREIGAWVLDEAHCLSKWGHDFRPDYRYIGRFIRERSGDEPIAPVLCLTATAKPDVVEDMLRHFRDKLAIELALFDGGSKRENLDFDVMQTTGAAKLAHVLQVLMHELPPEAPGGAIVYCSSRKRTEEVSAFLAQQGVASGFFHAGLPPEQKKLTQQRFIDGELRVMAATNAFGMGIDKPDVRLVIHADVPGSLENYLQEAGRAGRDLGAARCVLLYDKSDIERQFGLSARSRLAQREIQAVLRALRGLDRKKHGGGEVIATAGEILLEDEEGEFQRDALTDDTRVRTALAWLEEAALLTRDENVVQIFPSCLKVATLDEARARLAGRKLGPGGERSLLAIVETLMRANADEGVSTDELMFASALKPEALRHALFDLEKLGIASNDTALTAFVHTAGDRPSIRRFEEADALETALIDALREAAPDLGRDGVSHLQLRVLSQHLKDGGHPGALPDRLWRLLRSLAADGHREEDSRPSMELRKLDPETVQIRLQREWPAIRRTAELRRSGAKRLLDHLLTRVPAGVRRVDLMAETTLGELMQAIEADLLLSAEIKHPQQLLDRALLWLHEQEVIRLNKGLAVFRSAMTLRLDPERRNFAKSDFVPLQLHYDEQVVQIHVMAEYAELGLQALKQARQLVEDYFRLQRSQFIERWLPDRDKELARQTTPESWRAIVEALGNPAQQRIVADDRDAANVLVLAGPGSGKTRVLVHRIAYLLRVRRENPHGILALAYNRHAAAQIRRRLRELVGDDANGVTVLTCHALAMRLAGASFEGRAGQPGDEAFKEVMRQAVDLLEGKGLPPDDADEQRQRLMAGFRWILVDEYQDVGPEQYALISALAGRTRLGEDQRLSLFAVGDDDQNIYDFAGASVDYIRRFEADYAARPQYLTDNYRSTRHVIDAANAVIAGARDRLKADHPIVIDRARRKLPPGGRWQALDALAHGRVQELQVSPAPGAQALAALDELRRLAALSPDWDWRRAAVIAREWRLLQPMRAACELQGIAVQMADEEVPQFWRLRETQALLHWLRAERRLVTAAEIAAWLAAAREGPWWTLLREAADDYELETEGLALPVEHAIEWLAEWGRQARRRQHGLLLLTAHRAKGLEFDHVVLLDGGWQGKSGEDADAALRLRYVAMTRARETLTLMRAGASARFEPGPPALLRRTIPPPLQLPPELGWRHQRLTPADVVIGFAGRQAPSAQVHPAIARLTAGDPLHWRENGDLRELLTAEQVVVARLAEKFVLEPGWRCVRASVAAVVVRRRDQEDEAYRGAAKCEQWEVVLPELVLAHGAN